MSTTDSEGVPGRGDPIRAETGVEPPADTLPPPAVAAERPLAVDCQGVQKRFGDVVVLDDIDLQVEAGTIIGLIGPSGSGKTTVVRLMNGVYRPDAGSIRVLGNEPSERPTSERTDIGYLPQDPVLFDELSLWENINFHASLNGVPFRRRERLQRLFELVDLQGDEKKLVRESSGGMKRRLGLAASLVHDPKLLLLDEPTAGIDPILRSRFWERFREIASDGTTIVITTQFVEEAAHCDSVGVLADGRVRAVGTPGELRRQALGGDLVDVEFDGDVHQADVTRSCELDGVLAATVTGARTMRLTLRPDTEVAPISAALGDEHRKVTGANAVNTDWNDIFVALVEDPADEGRGDDADDAQLVGETQDGNP